MSEPQWSDEGVLRELESLRDIVMQSDRWHDGDPNSREVARRLRRMIARLTEPEPTTPPPAPTGEKEKGT